MFLKEKKKDLHLSWILEKTMEKAYFITESLQTHWETMIMVRPLDESVFVGPSQESFIRTKMLHSTKKAHTCLNSSIVLELFSELKNQEKRCTG